MEIIKVSYERIFPLAPYVNEKIGFEATIDGSVESEKDVLAKLKLISEDCHKAINPELYQPNGQLLSDNAIPTNKPSIITIERTSEDSRIAELIRDIYACTEINGDNGLLTYNKLASTCKEAQQAFDIMFKKLATASVNPEEILSCKDLIALESYRWSIKDDKELEIAYILRHDQLTTLTTT